MRGPVRTSPSASLSFSGGRHRVGRVAAAREGRVGHAALGAVQVDPLLALDHQSHPAPRIATSSRAKTGIRDGGIGLGRDVPPEHTAITWRLRGRCGGSGAFVGGVSGQGLTQKAPNPILVSHDEDRLTTDSVNAVPDRDSFLGRWFAQMRLVGRPRTRILLPLRFRRGPDHRSESPFRTPRPARIPFPCPNPWS